MSIDTSLVAARSVAPSAGQMRSRVLVEIRERGVAGATCDEVEQVLQMQHQTASARIRELVLEGRLVDSGYRRPTRSGHPAVIWVEPAADSAVRLVEAPRPALWLPRTLDDVEQSGGYQVLYVDPPWEYDQGGRGSTVKHYGTTGIEGICGLPVHRLASRDALLFMWVTWPFLRDCFRVIDAWGFEYLTCAFVWVKHHDGSGKRCVGGGFWSRANSEFCLLCRRGKNYPRRLETREARGVRQLIEEWPAEPEELLHAPRGEHSAKPPEARARIRQMLGPSPSAIELYARCTDENGKIAIGGRVDPTFDQWGNECESDVYMGVDGEEVIALL